MASNVSCHLLCGFPVFSTETQALIVHFGEENENYICGLTTQISMKVRPLPSPLPGLALSALCTENLYSVTGAFCSYSDFLRVD